MSHQKLVVALLILTSTGLAGCVESRAGEQTHVDDAARPLSLLEDPPRSVPSLMLAGNALEPVAYEWITDGKEIRYKASEEEDPGRLEYLSLEGPLLDLQIDSGVKPDQLSIVTYTETDKDGRPSALSGTEVDCLSPDSCTLSYSNESLQVLVEIEPHVKIVVIHVGYWGENAQAREGLYLYTATWGARGSN